MSSDRATGTRARGPRVFLIGIAAEMAGMHPQTLRVYERRGLITPGRTAKNTRVYSEKDVALLRRIQELSEEGLNLSGIERVLKLEGRLERAERRARDLEAELRAMLERHREELAAARAARGALVPAWRGSTALTQRHTPVALRTWMRRTV
ncbi:MAG TPA: MerR family transcriptional regulator [Miltoncostaeaceae bacterium]|nr:MerR family transcriptional regulator [Miltoncostaeaceae bacterium]